ncbi:MAG: OsmC family protein [bacterium]
MKRTATANWTGSGKEGKGSLTTQSKTLSNTQYSFTSRFENGTGTNPEELIAAAHAGCYTMALSFMLGGAGFEPNYINTTATINMEQKDNSWTVTNINLDVTANVKEIDATTFNNIANNAKTNCPISRMFNTAITMNAKLEN